MVTKQYLLEMEASLWLNKRSQNVAKGWLSTWCCWEAAIHTLDWSWKKVDIKLMMMMMMTEERVYERVSDIFIYVFILDHDEDSHNHIAIVSWNKALGNK